MKKSNIFFILAVFLVIFTIFSPKTMLFADVRGEPIDVIIALDKSKSMEEEIEEVKRYINTYLIDEHLIIGDYFLVITFYMKAHVAAAGYIRTEADKIELKKKISSIKADGAYTDIGNALDRLKDELTERLNNDRRKFFLLITDGKNEPPRNSKYYSRDGKLKHEYLDKLDELKIFKDWKVLALAIGGDQNALDFASKLEADYKEIDRGASAEDIDATVKGVGFMEIDKENQPQLTLNKNRNDVLPLAIKAGRYSSPQKVIINSINMTINGTTLGNIAGIPVDYTISNGSNEIKIPIFLKTDIASGDYTAQIDLDYATDVHFNKSIELAIHINSFFETNPWLLPLIIVLGIIILALIIFLLIKFISGKKIKFKAEVEERPFAKGKDVFIVSKTRELYLAEGMDLLRIIPQRNNKAIAKLSYFNAKLKLSIIKPEGLPELVKDQLDLIGKTIIVLTGNGTRYHVKFTITE